MKPLNLYWWLAGGLCLLLAGFGWRYHQAHYYTVKIGFTAEQIEFKVPDNPTIFWRPGSKLGADSNRINLQADELMLQHQWRDVSYTKLQEGLFLLELDGVRVFVFTGLFAPETLEPTLPVDFNSDWVVLQRSSLLPAAWPEPRLGWVVLNAGTLSKALKERSLATKKPVVRPVSAGTVWLQKLPDQPWQVLSPVD